MNYYNQNKQQEKSHSLSHMLKYNIDKQSKEETDGASTHMKVKTYNFLMGIDLNTMRNSICYSF